MNKKICFVTSTRADYSLLKPLLSLFNNDTETDLQLIVTGSHLSEIFGNTYKDIEKDGFSISEKINILTDDSKRGMGYSMGLACAGFSFAFEKLKPGLLVLLGDRYEIFCAASIAVVFNIPIAHIHGGEVTTGAIDDVFRNSITKMSSLHFTAADEYRNNIINMNVNPKYVYFTGSMAVDSVKSISLLSKEETEIELGLSLDKSILFTYHPETVSNMTIEQQCNEVFSALENFSSYNIVLTKSNADVGGLHINSRIEEFANSHKNSIARESLGQLLYYSTMKYSSVVMGNSSSGILETPIFKTPTVNIGSRQNGRIIAKNIINSKCLKEDITDAVNVALSKGFKNNLRNLINPFEKDNTCQNIFIIIKNYLDKEIRI